ncbi:hypothetical protein B7P43_G14754 [Cryptotermes secundus]|uniref:E3 ubiquitin-protein ligase n=1 Tax=Cryptotermes secundus TaxID=105785 RepID=A0A2J7PTU2_9NEOP|nr:hypothetical protein B7P43_G14754 [Cryptotermes secundus]
MSSVLDDFQRILDLLECPSCKITMSAPIFMCEVGHSACGSCKLTVQKCCICRARITDLKNDFAERMSAMMRTTCRYSRYGCPVKVNHDQRYQHEDACTFLHVECLAGIGEEGVKCGWRGKKTELLEHVVSVHGKSSVYMGQTIEDIECREFGRNFVNVTLWCAKGELFWMTVKQDIVKNTRMEVVQYIGSKRKATQFQYQHELKSLDGNMIFSFLNVTKNCFEDFDAVFASKSCFNIDLNFFKELFLNSKKRVPGYKLTIKKILQAYN